MVLIMCAEQKLKGCWTNKGKSLKKVSFSNLTKKHCSLRKITEYTHEFLVGPEPKPEFKGESRTFRLWLDTNQYQQDMAATVQGTEVKILGFFRIYLSDLYFKFLLFIGCLRDIQYSDETKTEGK